MKCKIAKQHKTKTDSPNAIKLKDEIVRCLDKQNFARAEALKTRYKNKYGTLILD